MTNTETTSLRDRDGRYAVGFDAICACGHTKGDHLAGNGRGAYECIVHETKNGEPCDCERFRKSRAP
jgi:hypothetical protein